MCVACCERFVRLLPEDIRGLIDVASRVADALVDEPDRKAARRAALEATSRLASVPRLGQSVQLLLRRDSELRPHAILTLLRGAAYHDAQTRQPRSPLSTESILTAETLEREAQCAVVREIFGNPFRPVAFDPEWRTDTAVSLARGMYESRDFSAMPILADALQDAGCENTEILTHCRDETLTHVRGCWAVDLVLGKA